MREIAAAAWLRLVVRSITVVLRRQALPAEPTVYTATEQTVTACLLLHTTVRKLAMHIATLAGTAVGDAKRALLLQLAWGVPG